MSGGVTRALDEQATAMQQIATSTESIRKQSEQSARGLAEQARAATEIHAATANIARQMQLMSQADVAQQAVDHVQELGTLKKARTGARD
jgi:methyl-accepting chemotaxis protein